MTDTVHWDESTLTLNGDPVSGVLVSPKDSPGLRPALSEVPGVQAPVPDSAGQADAAEEDAIFRSEDSDSSSDSSYKEEKESIKRKNKKRIIGVQKYFTRKDGIIYVEDSKWMDARQSTMNCHLFVGLNISEKPDLAERISAGDSEQLSTAAPTNISPTRQLPCRVRIQNELLYKDMRTITGFLTAQTDYVAPFRTLVIFEQEFRRVLEQKEAKFEDTSHKFPTHPAVLRKDPFLPSDYAYSASRLFGGDGRLDEVEEARILLDGYRALVQFLDTDLRDLVTTVQHFPFNCPESIIPKLPFSYLWFLFYPGQEIVSMNPKPQVYRVLQITGGRKSLVTRDSSKGSRRTISSLAVDCFCIDFDGKEFGAKPNTFYIRPYDDVLAVTELPVFPLVFARESLTEELAERGKKFESLVQPSHRKYKGLNLKEGDRFDVYEEINSDVMVDFRLAFQNSEAKIPLPIFGGGVILEPTAEDEEEIRDNGVLFDDIELLNSRWSKFFHKTELLRNQLPGTLTRDSHILLPYRVYGYVLLSRKWFPLDIDLIEKVAKVNPGENDGFQKLVLPDGHKEIVRALVNTHARQATRGGTISTSSEQREFDVVKGKGKGLIILLHGAPGVGKTSTAECVAANAGHPLLPITCGDLGGVSAKEVEQNLETFFDLARHWGCVLLLDEADVFLSMREKGDIRQVSLVSVFLRVLEYYSGILILTTNRVGSFDEAIKSRVHCALYYAPLDEQQSLKIWKMNLDMIDERNKATNSSQRVRFDRKEIEDYAETHWRSTDEGSRWNGRQIKNAFQTAIALADWDHFQHTEGDTRLGPLLRRTHFETVARASAHFDQYLQKVRGTDEFRAQTNEVRRDDIRNGLDKDSIEDTRKGSTSKIKARPKRKSKRAPSPESSEDSSKRSTAEEEASSSSDGSQSEEEPSPPPKPKKSSKRKSRKQ